MGNFYKPSSTKIIAINSSGTTVDLIYIDEVEEYLNQGDYHNFIRVTVINEQENARDSFYFDVENDYKLAHSYIQTSEKTMELLNLYMMMIQGKSDLNKFVVEAAKKLQADFGYKDLRIIKRL